VLPGHQLTGPSEEEEKGEEEEEEEDYNSINICHIHQNFTSV
jgi:hypothetical protein